VKNRFLDSHTPEAYFGRDLKEIKGENK